MCRVLQVSSSGYYKWRKQSPSLHAIADEALMGHLRASYAASNGTYGAPRVHRDLRDEGIAVGKKRVARLMREHGLVGRALRRRRVVTTGLDACVSRSRCTEPARAAVRCDRGGGVNRVWVSDITYIPTHEGWLYLAVVLDLASRRVVGWAMRETLQAELGGSVRLPDGGEHFASRPVAWCITPIEGFSTPVRSIGRCSRRTACKRSMSRRGNCWDKRAVAESFFATMELELIVRASWDTHDDARVAIFEFIESWYNRRRRHSTLGYLSPAQGVIRVNSFRRSGKCSFPRCPLKRVKPNTSFCHLVFTSLCPLVSASQISWGLPEAVIGSSSNAIFTLPSTNDARAAYHARSPYLGSNSESRAPKSRAYNTLPPSLPSASRSTEGNIAARLTPRDMIRAASNVQSGLMGRPGTTESCSFGTCWPNEVAAASFSTACITTFTRSPARDCSSLSAASSACCRLHASVPATICSAASGRTPIERSRATRAAKCQPSSRNTNACLMPAIFTAFRIAGAVADIVYDCVS